MYTNILFVRFCSGPDDLFWFFYSKQVHIPFQSLILAYTYPPDCVHLFLSPCQGGKWVALVEKDMCLPSSCLYMESASNPIFPQQFALGVVPEPGKSNTSGSHNIKEGMGRLEYAFAQLVTFLTLDSLLDRNLQGNHPCWASAFCLDIAVWLTCVFQSRLHGTLNYKFTLIVFGYLFPCPLQRAQCLPEQVKRNK